MLTKKEVAVLLALRGADDGLLEADFREATRREVSAHTVLEEQLVPLQQRGLISSTAEVPTDRRIHGTVDRYALTAAGEQALAATPGVGRAPAAAAGMAPACHGETA